MIYKLVDKKIKNDDIVDDNKIDYYKDDRKIKKMGNNLHVV